jgi:hypothetical protein
VDLESFIRLTREDSIIEYAGAFFLLGASILCLYLFLHPLINKSLVVENKFRNNISYLFLSIVLFLSFAEEISWGQRIFNWKSSQYFIAENIQHETNVHNLKFGAFLSLNRLFPIFWIFYCLVVPIAVKLSKKVETTLNKIHLPLAPIWLGVAILINAIIPKMLSLVIDIQYERVIWGMHEVKETILEMLLYILASYWMLNNARIDSNVKKY